MDSSEPGLYLGTASILARLLFIYGTHAKEEKGRDKQQLTGQEPATFTYIADPWAAELWSPPVSINRFSP